MKEFLQAVEIVKAKLASCDPTMEVIDSWENTARKNPQARRLATVGIQKVSLLPISLGDFCGKVGDCKKAEICFKLSFCAPSAKECWQLWEKCMQKFIFAKEIGFSQAESGEASWKKEWGGVVLPIKLCCEILISEDRVPGQPMPDKVKIIRKGETL